MLSHTARARPVLCCSPLFSRHDQQKENGYQQRKKNGDKYGGSHEQSPTNSLPLGDHDSGRMLACPRLDPTGRITRDSPI